MKFKKLLLISTSATIVAASLIALAAACHDENQKKPGNGNNKEVNKDSKTSENKGEQTKQNTNPELNQKQTNKKDQLNEQNKTSQTEKEKPQLGQNNNSTEQPIEPQENQDDINEPSDVSFVSENPVINQEVDYHSNLQLRINDKFLNSSSPKLLKITLKPYKKEDNKTIIGEGFYEIKNTDKNIINFYLKGIDPKIEYSLQSVAVYDYDTKQQQIFNEKNLNLSRKIKRTKIIVKQTEYTPKLEENGEQKIPVTVKTEITKSGSDYNIELTFNTKDNNDQINSKYAAITITYGDYTGLDTIHSEIKNHKIINNKVKIPIKPVYIKNKNNQEFHVSLQRIADSETSNLNSATFRIDYKSPGSVVDSNQNLIFKLSANKLIDEAN